MLTALAIAAFILLSAFASLLAIGMCKVASKADQQREKEQQDWLHPKS